MRNLVESILNKDYTKANDHLHEELKNIVARKLNEAKKMFAAKMSVESDDPDGRMGEANVHKAIVQDLIHIANGGKNPKIVGKQVNAKTAQNHLTKLANSEGDHRDTVNDVTNIHGGGIHYPTKEDSADLVRIAQRWHKGSDKMSMKEQLNVDKRGNYNETGGRDVILSHEKQKRGLAEGDVVPLDPSKRKKETDAVTKHVGKEHTVLGSDGQMSVYDNEGKHKFTIDNGSSMTAYYRHYDKHGDVEAALDHMKKNTTPSYTKPKSADIEQIKEEAKRAAMKSLQEKVRARNVTPETIKTAQQHSNETAKEKPTDPAAFFRMKNRNTVVSMKKK